ncbi:MAG: hypothetical protein EB101_02735 [Chitinophagia bacterium]|nr:hypothetical protein [Chitinophagia bacterium]
MGGLSKEEAQHILQEVGYNELEEKKARGLSSLLAAVFSEPMFFLLLGAAGLYVLLGNYKEGLVLSLAMVLIITITFFQKQKSSRALAALKKLSSPRALVLRDNRPERIPGKEVVPGDWLVLSAGDRVAADATLLESSGLHADESLLTGESAAVHKDVSGDNVLFAGSLIVSGKGVGVVSSTGGRSLLGKIGGSVQSIVSRKTGLQIASALLTRRLLWIGLFLSVSVVVAFYLTRGSFLDALLTGLSASMAILPEEFPVVLTVFLAIGAWRISQNNVLTRNPSAIESLGAATVLCADKTGTITQNKMELALLYNGVDWLERSSFGGRNIHSRMIYWRLPACLMRVREVILWWLQRGHRKPFSAFVCSLIKKKKDITALFIQWQIGVSGYWGWHAPLLVGVVFLIIHPVFLFRSWVFLVLKILLGQK